MKEIKELQSLSLVGKNVIVRVDYNLAIRDGKVLDDLRIRTSTKTIEFLRSLGAAVILISHIENKEGTGLNPVAEHIHSMHQAGTCPFDVIFHDNLAMALSKSKVDYAQAGQVHLLQNLRDNMGEEINDSAFAHSLAALGDIYINEAFPVCHRKHASVVGLPMLLPHYAGFKLIDEVHHMQKGLEAKHPFVFILGGAKFETKLPLIEKFINRSDIVVIGGALLNDILKAKGLNVGKSLVSEVPVDLSSIIASPKLLLPEEVIVKSDVSDTGTTKKITEISENDIIIDVVPKFAEALSKRLDEVSATSEKGAKPFILWNGPLGLYESGFKEGTVSVADMILKKNVEGLVGGGDTVAAIAECALGHTIGSEQGGIYISTGGGAMIEFLMKESLPGVEVLK